MKLLRNVFLLNIGLGLFCISSSAMSRQQLSDSDRYEAIKYALEFENHIDDAFHELARSSDELGSCQIMELFIRVKGIQIINQKNRLGMTPLHSAMLAGRRRTAFYLLARGADATITDNKGKFAIHPLKLANNPVNAHEIMESLFKKYGPQCIDQQDIFGMTALHSAAQAGYGKIVPYLLEQGADVMLVNCEGKLAFELAYNAGHKNIVDLLAGFYQEAVTRKYSGRDLMNRGVCYSRL